LYQDVQFVIARTDLLWRANLGQIPGAILDGFFELAAVDASRTNAIYRRTRKPADAYRRDPARFAENVAHVSRLTRATVDGRSVAPDRFGAELPFLREDARPRTFTRHLEFDVAFGRMDADVSALYIRGIDSKEPCTLTFTLFDSAGRKTLERTIAVGAGRMSVFESFAPPARARSGALKFDTAGSDQLTITDFRVQGQSPALKDYIGRTLRFPASDSAVSAPPAPPADRR
jgi:hypothetical protein